MAKKTYRLWRYSNGRLMDGVVLVEASSSTAAISAAHDMFDAPGYPLSRTHQSFTVCPSRDKGEG